jgi:endonuclease YncB( thermonuclease family)
MIRATLRSSIILTIISSSVFAQSPDKVRVIRVVDGDTIGLEINGEFRVCRLIGVDTPETAEADPWRRKVGKIATAELNKLLVSQDTSIGYGGRSPTSDRYGRTLIYLYRDNGILGPPLLVNQDLILKGLGVAYLKFPFAFSPDFASAERTARANKVGLWDDESAVESARLAAKTVAERARAAPKIVAKKKRPDPPAEVSSMPTSRSRLSSESSGPMASGLCGATTKKGAPCRRPVAGGGYCYQHR